jgi:hypothetical protein
MTHTKGNIIVEEIKIGDTHYEFEYGMCIETKVLTLPVRDDEGYWSWKSVSVKNEKIIDYGVHEKYSHYAPNLYDCIAYEGCKMI